MREAEPLHTVPPLARRRVLHFTACSAFLPFLLCSFFLAELLLASHLLFPFFLAVCVVQQLTPAPQAHLAHVWANHTPHCCKRSSESNIITQPCAALCCEALRRQSCWQTSTARMQANLSSMLASFLTTMRRSGSTIRMRQSFSNVWKRN